MNKRQRNFQKILEYKQRFQKLPSETIRYRLGIGSLVKEAEIAYREILEERGEKVYLTESAEAETIENRAQHDPNQ